MAVLVEVRPEVGQCPFSSEMQRRWVVERIAFVDDKPLVARTACGLIVGLVKEDCDGLRVTQDSMQDLIGDTFSAVRVGGGNRLIQKFPRRLGRADNRRPGWRFGGHGLISRRKSGGALFSLLDLPQPQTGGVCDRITDAHARRFNRLELFDVDDAADLFPDQVPLALSDVQLGREGLKIIVDVFQVLYQVGELSFVADRPANRRRQRRAPLKGRPRCCDLGVGSDQAGCSRLKLRGKGSKYR